MEIKLERYYSDERQTFGLLYIGTVFGCYTLEDQHRAEKVAGSTRIPEGCYRLKLRKFGGHHNRYAKRFPDFHIGMVEITGVEGFTDILFHIGNTPEDTAGCVLCGLAQSLHEGDVPLGRSAQGYEKFYKAVAPQLELGEDIWLTVVSREGV